MLGKMKHNVLWGLATLALSLGFAGSSYVFETEQKAHASTNEWLYMIFPASIENIGDCATVFRNAKACNTSFKFKGNTEGQRTIPYGCITSNSEAFDITTHYDTDFSSSSNGKKKLRVTTGLEYSVAGTSGGHNKKIRIDSTDTQHNESSTACCIHAQTGALWGQENYTGTDTCGIDADGQESDMNDKLRVLRAKGAFEDA